MALLTNEITRIRLQSFQKTYLWEIYLPVIDTRTPASSGLLNTVKQLVETAVQFVDEVSTLVENVRYSDYSVDANVLRYGSRQSFFAGFLKKEAFQLTFRDTEGASARKYLRAWRNLIVTDKGLFKKKIGGYAKDVVLQYTNSLGVTISKVKFVNSFPLTMPSPSLTYNEGGILKFDIMFACDKIEETQGYSVELL